MASTESFNANLVGAGLRRVARGMRKWLMTRTAK